MKCVLKNVENQTVKMNFFIPDEKRSDRIRIDRTTIDNKRSHCLYRSSPLVLSNTFSCSRYVEICEVLHASDFFSKIISNRLLERNDWMKLIGEKQSYHKDSDGTSVFFYIEIVARIFELFLRKADLWTKEQETSYKRFHYIFE